ncbi:MAG: stage II sporulation protein M [Eubacterium sp.]|nr:stage II sporulation protein M [Eubacterium sp.]
MNNNVKKDINIFDLILKNKEIIYPALMYITGMLIGSFLLTYSNPASELFKSFFGIKSDEFISIFLFNFGVYLSIYTITILLGMCLIGFPFISLIPFTLGIIISMKAAYYYINYPIKGIGYSLLMIAPESSVFLTVLILTISKSSKLSKYIYNLTLKKENMTEEIELQSYLRSFLIYALIVSFTSFINALATYFLNSIIHL